MLPLPSPASALCSRTLGSSPPPSTRSDPDRIADAQPALGPLGIVVRQLVAHHEHPHLQRVHAGVPQAGAGRSTASAGGPAASAAVVTAAGCAASCASAVPRRPRPAQPRLRPSPAGARAMIVSVRCRCRARVRESKARHGAVPILPCEHDRPRRGSARRLNADDRPARRPSRRDPPARRGGLHRLRERRRGAPLRPARRRARRHDLPQLLAEPFADEYAEPCAASTRARRSRILAQRREVVASQPDGSAMRSS